MQRLPMLSAQECLPIVERVMALSGHWLQRGPVDFYTLGAASYLDGAWDNDPYRSRRMATNPILQSAFAGLYALVVNRLSAALACDVAFHPELALPGFHVFAAKPGEPMLPSTPAMAAAGGSIHRDLQYQSHRTLWQRYNYVDWQHPLSFTLPLELPAAGGGLNIWPAHGPLDDLKHCTPERIPYRSGELVWFCTPLAHQIAPVQPVSENDRRLTLQGHGLRCGGCWLLYF